ncbi:hypothetical protein OAC51_08150 [Flavobacteriaceae bacterium]|nr:hypothetical protein [Flavobacteriaceae bacterium]MDC1285197.1 hypothetical protein [Flavobacteriaceae bacterium]PTM00900.1 MAG: hypothetical protein DA394_04780 [Candidatus Arcticimaribacter sp.]
MCQIRTATILFFVFTFLSSSSSLHDYYVSSTEVVFVEDKQQLQVTTRVFIDDLEAYFNAQTEDKIQLQPDLEPAKIDSLVHVFFKNNFNIFFDKKEVGIQYIGRQYKEDQILIFAEATEVSPPTSIEIHNTILIPFRSDQQNIVHLKTVNSKKSFLMDASKTILAQLWIH